MKMSKTKNIFLHIFLIVSSLLVLLPFLWMLSISLSASGSVFDRFLLLFPTKFSLDGYREVLRTTPFMRWFLNSAYISVILTLGQLVLGIFAAYAFSRYNFRFREPLFFLVLCTMMIPPQAILLPLFMVVNKFGWINSYNGVIIPHLANGYSIFVLRQFFLTVPKELDEASQIDGCRPFQTLYHVYIRSAIPALISVGLIQLVRNWNDYYWALVVLMDSKKLTLPVGIVTFRDETLVQWVPTMAVSTLSVIPVLLIYLVGQKYFVMSHSRSGIK